MYLNIYLFLFLPIIVISILSTSVLGAKHIHVNVEEYHTCIPITFRPFHTRAVPSQEINILGERLRATRHHIIPFSTLRDFLNLVLSENPRDPRLGSYLAINMGAIFNFFEENPNAGAFDPPRATTTPTMYLYLHGDTPISFLGRRTQSFDVDHRMLAAFTWMPGNLFYGPPPDRRSSDPGDQFDEGAEIIVGERSYEVLRRLYQNMQHYINNPRQRTSHYFDIILDDLLMVATERNRPYEFESRQWWVSGHNRRRMPMFDLYRAVRSNVEIEEITTPTSFNDDHDELLRKRSIGGGFADEEYVSAAHTVCNEYVKHLRPQLNTIFTAIDIDYDVLPLFVYTTKDGYFAYGQNKNTLRWFIWNVDRYGKLGAVSAEGSWQFYYGVQVHYEINGKHYFYGHNLENHYWFIQELTADGRMGQETDNGFFKFSYKTMFYIQINGQHYLYGQNAVERNWFLQLLNSGGTLGREVSHGTWDNFYDIQFPFTVGDNQYFAGLNTNSNRHFIRDINENSIGSMGTSKVWGTLPYSVFFPFTFSGQTYFFGFESYGNKYTISKVFSSIVEQYSLSYQLNDVKPFNINGYQYFYARRSGSSKWGLLHFDASYSDN